MDWLSKYESLVPNKNFDINTAFQQVGKTELGKPVDISQLEILAGHICTNLDINSKDQIIDFGCGNGMLSKEIAKKAKYVLGIDQSPNLISTAHKYFSSDKVNYLQSNICDFYDECQEEKFELFNKAFSCEVFQYLDPLLLESHLKQVSKIGQKGFKYLIIGIPDLERIKNFYNSPARWQLYQNNLEKNNDQIGYWWKKKDIVDIANISNFSCKIIEMSDIYNSHYRFSALLEFCN